MRDVSVQVTSRSLDVAEWTLERLSSAYGTRPISVSMMTPEGMQATTEQWPFARWVAMASAGGPSHGTPYLRNLALPDSLLPAALQHSPFAAESTACTLFAGANAASSELHSDGIANALLILHGTKLVVILRDNGIDELSCAEAAALNIVIAERAASGGFPRPQRRPRWKSALPGRGAATDRSATGCVAIGSLVLHYAWLDAGAMLLIPRGWLHYARCFGSTLSITYWEKPPPRPSASPRSNALSAPTASAGTESQAPQPTTASTQATLDALPAALIEAVLCCCFGAAGEAAPPVARARVVCRAASTCHVLRDGANESLWRFGYALHWGARAVESAAEWSSGSVVARRWAQAFACMHNLLLGEEMRARPRAAVLALRNKGLVRSHADLAALLHAHHAWVDADALTELLSAPPSTTELFSTDEGGVLHRSHLEEVTRDEFTREAFTRGVHTRRSHRSLLEEWLEVLAPSLRGLSLEGSLRLFLLLCRLPGEAPRIDRLLERLAAVHFRENPDGPFADADSAYIFCYSMIMLNTDLHNDSIPAARKMTAEQFERSNRGINAGGNLDAAFVHGIHESIKECGLMLRPQ